MAKILIIEDNKDVNLMLAEALSDAGHVVASSYTGIDGFKEIKKEIYDLVLLDIMLPYKSGDEVLREVRQFSQIPIMIISAKDMVSIKIDLLKLGADDYMTKPFDLGEVTARVDALLRRFSSASAENRKYYYKDLILDEDSMHVMVGHKEIDLTAKEYTILAMLVKNAHKVFTKANLYESIWQEQYFGDDNAVKTHISNLRNKLKQVNPNDDYIETVWGMGYRLYKNNN